MVPAQEEAEKDSGQHVPRARTCPGLARAPAGEWLRAQAREWLEPAPFLRVVPTDSLYLFDSLWKECQF